jgi:hypothetical protein
MALTGTITVSTCGGHAVLFSTGNDNFRAKTLLINNLGVGNVWLDISTTSGGSTGYQINTATAVTLNHLGGIRGFSIIASTAAGVPVVTYLASR